MLSKIIPRSYFSVQYGAIISFLYAILYQWFWSENIVCWKNRIYVCITYVIARVLFSLFRFDVIPNKAIGSIRKRGKCLSLFILILDECINLYTIDTICAIYAISNPSLFHIENFLFISITGINYV